MASCRDATTERGRFCVVLEELGRRHRSETLATSHPGAYDYYNAEQRISDWGMPTASTTPRVSCPVWPLERPPVMVPRWEWEWYGRGPSLHAPQSLMRALSHAVVHVLAPHPSLCPGHPSPGRHLSRLPPLDPCCRQSCCPTALTTTRWQCSHPQVGALLGIGHIRCHSVQGEQAPDGPAAKTLAATTSGCDGDGCDPPRCWLGGRPQSANQLAAYQIGSRHLHNSTSFPLLQRVAQIIDRYALAVRPGGRLLCVAS